MARQVKSEDRVVTAVRLPRELHERLQSTATERGTSVTHLMTLAAELFLDNLPPLDPIVSRDMALPR